MYIGISTSCFYPIFTEDAIDKIVKLGFTEIEVFLNSDSEFSDDYMKKLKRKVDEYSINVKSIHPYSSASEGIMFFSDYSRRTNDSFETYKSYFECANRLGARYLTFHGSRKTSLSGTSFDTQEIKYDVYDRLCDIASSFGVGIAQENVAWCKSSDPQYIKKLYDNLPKLRYTLDIKQANRAGHDYIEYLDIMSDRLVNVHINDYTGIKTCLLPGEGIMDYNEFFTKLKDFGYRSSVLIEVYSKNYDSFIQIKQSAAHLKKISDMIFI